MDAAKLLTTRRFLPLWLTQFLGAFADNMLKNAVAILVIYRLAEEAGTDGRVMATLIGAVFVLPFFLLSGTAGQISDKYDRARVARAVKVAEVGLMALAAVGFLAADMWVLLAVVFGMGVHSTVFGPLKYSLLPDHLRPGELVAGNGLIEAGTFLAILAGTVAGGAVILEDWGPWAVSLGLVAVALAGLAASWRIPPAPVRAPGLRLDPNPLRETVAIVAQARRNGTVWLCVLGLSWFWAVGALLLSQVPALAKDVIGGDAQVVTALLVAFSVGVGIGSVACHRILAGRVSPWPVPFAAIGISAFAVDLYLAAGAFAPIPGAAPMGVGAFLALPGAWRLLGDLAMLAFCGGVYSIPLYALLQTESEPESRSRAIAANNVVNAVFMVAAAAAAAALLWLGASVPEVILAAGVANVAVALYACWILPADMLKALLRALFTLAYKVQVRGLENLERAGPRAIVVANHVSFLDAALLATFLPGRMTFAIDVAMSRRWWVRPFLKVVDALPLNPANPHSLKSFIKAVRDGGKPGVIFPEGRLTRTGGLMKVYPGPAMAAEKAEADIVPVRLDGVQFLPFTRLGGKMPRRWFPRVSITVLPPTRIELPPGLKGRARRRAGALAMHDVLSGMMYETTPRDMTLFQGLLAARETYGGGREILEDVERAPVTYDDLVMRSLVLGRRVAKATRRGEAVGVLLPTSVACATALFAVTAFGRVAAMLNFSTGAENMALGCRAAEVRTVLTSRRFVEMARLGPAVERLSQACRVVYLEDVRAEIGLLDKAFGALASRCAGWLHRRHAPDPGAPAVVLFTSGTEGTPKGVVHAHRAFHANRNQIAARFAFSQDKLFFNPLPVFHSFGLTGGLLLPLMSGMRTFLYPSPLHGRIIAELCYELRPNLIYGTGTFLRNWGAVADDADFESIEFAIAGAERVKEDCRRMWADRFGKRILEGYGATETAPVIAVNTPSHARPGTVGRVLPGIETRLEPVPGFEGGERLSVRGDNVMLGYYRAEAPGVLEPPPGGWYDTGDIVRVDADGFVSIVGRAKRIAKPGGEQVSLDAVEALAAEAWPGAQVAAVAVPDERKGDRIVLVTDRAGAARDDLLARARERQVGEIMVPRDVLAVAALPLLGTGKVDYRAVERLALEAREGAGA
jgi:acyl-[acyl-carrier-protein]-phospholipid O-acyltransferase/long-chain-fatty-acid--[acyl-carrier-protein] ligase